MPWILTEDALLVCAHELGHVNNQPTQSLFTIGGRRVLVEPDPEGKSITRCPNLGLTIKPCTSTLKVQVGYSADLKVDGTALCLGTVSGMTDGTPPATVKYYVRSPGQTPLEDQ